MAFATILFFVGSVSRDRVEVIVNETVLTVELADTPEKRALGLSGRDGLGDIDGMLFIFDSEGVRSVWMKEMFFSIDLVWIDPDHIVVGVDEMITPETFPESFHSPVPVLFLLELEAGLVERLGISVGDEVRFEGF